MISKIAIIFLTLFFSLCAAALFINPVFGLYSYIVEYFVHPPIRWWGYLLPTKRFALIASSVTLISYFLQYKKFSRNRVFTLPQYKWLALFTLVVVATWLVAVDREIHVEWMTIYIKYVLLVYLIIKIVDSPGKFEGVMGFFLAGQFYWGWLARQIGRTGDGRLENIGGADSAKANPTAAVLIVAIPLLIHYLLNGRKWQKICALPVLAYVINALILINSRGAFLGIIVSMIYYFILYMKAPSSGRSKVKIIAGLVMGAALFLYLTDAVFLERMETISDANDPGRSRVNYWFRTFDMLKDHPFGVGAFGYELLSPQYLPQHALAETGRRAVHSTYFEVLAEYGYHGFILFMLFLYANFRYLMNMKKAMIQRKEEAFYYMTIALEAGLIAHLVAAVFINRLYSEILYWMVAFIAAYGNIYYKTNFKNMRGVDG